MKSTRRCPSKADAVERTRLFGRWQLKETSQRDLDESLFGYVLLDDCGNPQRTGEIGSDRQR